MVRDVPPDDELRQLRDGDVHVVVRPGDPPTYRFDPERDESRVARLVVDDALKRAAGRSDPWPAREEPIVVAGSRYIDWLIPGLIGMNIMSNGMWGIGFSIVQARLRKLLKRLVASPMRSATTCSRRCSRGWCSSAPRSRCRSCSARWRSACRSAARSLASAVVALLGALTFSAHRLLRRRAGRGRSRRSPALLNLTMLPMWVLSGVFFSSSNFPAVVQPVIQALPLTALNDALRAVILEGASLGAIRVELLTLMTWAIVTFSIGLRIFKWR